MHCLDQILEHLAARIKDRIPALRYTIQHGHNDRFPWWVVTRLVNGTKALDISIDCLGTPQAWEIRADWACANGLVRQALPPIWQVMSPNRGLRDSPMEVVMRQIEDFLIRQVPGMIQELS